MEFNDLSSEAKAIALLSGRKQGEEFHFNGLPMTYAEKIEHDEGLSALHKKMEELKPRWKLEEDKILEEIKSNVPPPLSALFWHIYHKRVLEPTWKWYN
jgi:hypothetical protein